MPQSKGRAALSLLDSLAELWLGGRGSRIIEALPGGEKGDFTLMGPGILYRWNQGFEPISISHLGEGKQTVSTSDWSYLLFLKSDTEDLTLETASGSIHRIKLENATTRQHINDTLGVLQRAIQSQDSLSLIATSLRMVALARIPQVADPINSRKRFVTDLHEWFSAQMDSPIKLNDAAEAFGKSPRQLIRILKEATGTGFAEHLALRRLLLARTLLMRTAASVIEIAKATGFKGREQFIRSFSKHFGWTPLQFRISWNQASTTNGDLVDLCRVSDKSDVNWISSGEEAPSPHGPLAHTLTVANATHAVVELFSVDPDGHLSRNRLLERGEMIFNPQAADGSLWLVRSSAADFEKRFTIPSDHAHAVVTPDR